MIACLLIPYFAAAVERRDSPALAAGPLVISQPLPHPGPVFAVCAEAARRGIQPGLPLDQAQLLCPESTLLPARMTHYHQTTEALFSLLTGFTHRLEAEPHPLAAVTYLDLSGWPLPESRRLAQELGRAVRQETGLAPALGVAINKFVAHLAAGSTSPHHLSLVPPGREAGFLAAKPLDWLPLEAETRERLHRLGLTTLGQVAALPAAAVLAQFGTAGRQAQQLAQGRDERPLRPHQPDPVVRLTRWLDGPVADRLVLTAILKLMAEELAAGLVRSGRAGRRLTLTLHLEEGQEWLVEHALSQPTSRAERLFFSLSGSLAQNWPNSGVVGLTLSLAEIGPVQPQQLDLFTPSGGQAQRLHELLPHLIARYGAAAFGQPCLTNPLAALPERRFQMQGVANPL